MGLIGGEFGYRLLRILWREPKPPKRATQADIGFMNQARDVDGYTCRACLWIFPAYSHQPCPSFCPRCGSVITGVVQNFVVAGISR